MFLVKILLLVMIAGALTSIFTFVADVWIWHEKEKKVFIIPSADEPEEKVEKEVEDNGINDGEHNSSAVSLPWCQS